MVSKKVLIAMKVTIYINYKENKESNEMKQFETIIQFKT
jgi:hypothetical protein